MKQRNSWQLAGQPTVPSTGTESLKTGKSNRLSGTMALLCSALVISLQLLGSRAHAQIADYTGSGGTSTSITYYSNESGTVLQKTGFGSNTSCGSGGLSGMTVNTSVTSYASGNPHVFFKVTPNAGFVLNVSGLSAICRSSGTGATKARLAYSLDGGTTWTAESADHTQATSGGCGASTNSFSWTGGLTLSGVTTTNGIIVAIYPYTPGGSTGTFQVNQFHLNGSVVAVSGCSGTPTAGTTAASPSSFCGSGSSVLTLSGASGGSGITYQWQSSATGVGGSFSNISGATDVTYTTPTISTTTYYQAITTCTVSALSATSASSAVTINAVPSVAAISGTTLVNTGATTTLSDATPSGVWSSSNTAVGTIGSATGIVSGIHAGTTIITYSVTSGGCTGLATTTVSVIAPGTLATYIGTAGTSVSTIAIANETVGSLTTTGFGSNSPCTTGGLSGLTVNTVNATYSAAGPHVYYQILPASGFQLNVTGITAVTRESSTGPTLARIAYSLDGGATWVDDLTDHAQSTGGSCGAASNTFSWAGGLTVFGITSTTDGIIVAVYPYAPGASTGTVQVNALTVFGNVTAAGTCTTVTGGSVGAAPSLICNSGASTLTLTGATSGAGISYQWQNSSDGITFADITGATNTSYASPTLTSTTYYQAVTTCTSGATATSSVATVTVNPIPAAGTITGVPTYVFIGTPSTLSNATTGGVWSSDHVGVATIGSGDGIVNGLIPGTTVITYSVTTGGCTGRTAATVSVLHPNTIAAYLGTDGTSTATTAFSGDATTALTAVGFGTVTPCGSGGYSGITNNGVTTFSTANANVYFKVTATAGNYVDVSGFHATLRRSNSGITKVRMAYSTDNGASWNDDGIDQAPDNAGCSNSITDFSYSAALPTGINSSSDGVIFALYPYDPIATGGTIQVNAIDIVGTINPCPAVAAIGGGDVAICAGSSVTLTDAVASGTWSSSDEATATVGSATGIVNGVANGVATISYAVGTVCGTSFATTTITVNALPTVDAITGTLSVCVGAVTSLADATVGGAWGSSDILTANIDETTGVVTGVAAGTATIEYVIEDGVTGCTNRTTAVVTVNPLPSVEAIDGGMGVCVLEEDFLTDATADGVWSSSDDAIATIASDGTYDGVSGGTATISYTVTNAFGCSASATAVVTVNALPVLDTITGTLTVCVDGTTTLGNSTAGGNWVSGDESLATIDASGVVTGISAGTDLIIYVVTNEFGCTATVTTNVEVVVCEGKPGIKTNTAITNVNSDITLYPNPAKNTLHVSAAQKVNVTIIGIDGKILIDQKEATDINVSALADGMYVVKVYDMQNNLVKTTRFTKN